MSSKFILMGILCLFMNNLKAQSGCTDPAASNYNPVATANDGSCTYGAVSISPTLKGNLPSSLLENSGIVYWNSRIWTHNDGGNTPELFEMDTVGNVIRTVNITNATNIDWEDIAQDNNYIYVGDFGNNASGNRTDLRIYRVSKADLLAGNSVNADVINFHYADQTDFTALPGNTTNFDCESMIIYNGNVYLFTKQWTALGTSVYSVPITPGTWAAQKVSSNTAPAGLVTGADVAEAQRSIALCGYTSGGARFLYLLYDFSGVDFFSGNKRYITLNNFGQTEGIAFKNPEYVFISRESLTRVVFGIPITITQALERVNLTTLLNPYYQLLPFTWIDLKVATDDGSRNIRWNIQPASEFNAGWLQRRSASTPEYHNVTRINVAAGEYTDNNVQLMEENVVYRIEAQDKAFRHYFSKEVGAAAKTGTTKISAKNREVLIRSGHRTPGQIGIFTISGQRILQVGYQEEKRLDLSFLQKGIYVVKVVGSDGTLRKQVKIWL